MRKNIVLLFLVVSTGFCIKKLALQPTFIDVSATQLPGKDPSSNSMDIEAVDIDNDGDPDYIIASEFRPNLVYINDGNGKFTDQTKERLPMKNTDSEDIAAGDFDNDGDIDLFFANEDTHIHEYYINDGKGFFTDAGQNIPVKSKANAVLSADFDKDGDLDMILGNEGQDIFLENNGKGNFTERATRLPADNNVTQDIEAADLDGDKDLDLVVGNEDGNKILLNDGKGNFTDTNDRLLLSGVNEETRKVDIADLDNDGDPDLFFSNVNFRGIKNPANRVLINNGKGFFTDETKERYAGENMFHTADAAFTDIDKDGDLDLFVANVFGGKQQYFENNGKGFFAEKTSTLYPRNPTTEGISIEVGDINKDGLADIYFGCFRSMDILLIQKK